MPPFLSHHPCEGWVEQACVPSQHLLQTGPSQRSVLISGLAGMDAEHSIAGLGWKVRGGGQLSGGMTVFPTGWTLKATVSMPTRI